MVELRWTPLEHVPLSRAPSSPLWYLAEPLSDGRWQCFAGIGLAETLFWEEPAFLVTAQTLEAQFGIFSGVIEEAELPDLFVRPLLGDSRTYAVKDDLRDLGGKWVKGMKAWAIPVRRYAEACALLEEETNDGLFA